MRKGSEEKPDTAGTVRSNRRRGTRGRSVEVCAAWLWDGTIGELIRVGDGGNIHIPLSAIPKLPQGDSVHRVFLELRLHPMAQGTPGRTGTDAADSGGESLS
jgi:hypothetical protein